MELRSTLTIILLQSCPCAKCLLFFVFLQIGGQLKCLQLVAGLTSERDGEIRKAALNTMATAYKNLGVHLLCLDCTIITGIVLL